MLVYESHDLIQSLDGLWKSRVDRREHHRRVELDQLDLASRSAIGQDEFFLNSVTEELLSSST